MCLAYLHIREKHLEHIRAWVPGVEKHELGFLQMIGRETLLNLKIAAVKDINDKEVDQGNSCVGIINSLWDLGNLWEQKNGFWGSQMSPF